MGIANQPEHNVAVISGDEDLMRILNDPDPNWALLKQNPYKADAVRVSFGDPAITGIPKEQSNPDFIMNVWKNGEKLGPVTDDMLLRDDDGNVLHAKYDIHWSVIEYTYEKAREMMNPKVERAAAKVLNFSSAYGASPASLERKIESDTGVKPDEGTGEKGLEAIAARQPRATEFLEDMAEVPKKKGFYRAASGRVRHCILHGSGAGIGWRTRNSQESALGREMRNFPYCIGELKLGELMGSPIFSTHKVLIDFCGVLGNHEPSYRSNPIEGATTRSRYLSEVCNGPTSAQLSLN